MPKLKKDYSDLSKEQLIDIINQLEKNKQYGLVWDVEREPELVVENCKKMLPVLVEDESKSIQKNQDLPQNLIIEGDNYHALSVLNYTHAGKIDLIYIDPPYNTGNKDFTYNDKFVDIKDTYGHSKWLNFMNSRLRLSKDLLKDNGFIFISIDDNEQAQLKLLCDSIFGEDNFIAQIVVESGEVFGTKAAHANKTFVKVKDYVLVYVKSKSYTLRQPLYDNMRELYDSHFNTVIEEDLSKSSIAKYLNKIDWVVKEFEKYYLKINYENINLMMTISEKFRKFIYIELAPKLYTDQPYNAQIENEIIGKYENGKPFVYDNKLLFITSSGSVRMLISFAKSLKESDASQPMYSRCTIRGDLWKDFHFDMRNVQDEGGVSLKNGKKPIRLIKQLVKWVNKKDILLLDFFAGSGSSGHAILNMNKEDGGYRRFILCTNNENQIAETITYPRIKNVINGYSGKPPIEANVRYFKTDFVPYTSNKSQLRVDIAYRCTEMLCIKESIFTFLKKDDSWKLFKEGSKIMAVYYDDFEDDQMDILMNELNQEEGEKILYRFCNSILGFSDDEEKEFAQKGIKLKPIPQKILDVYKQLYK